MKFEFNNNEIALLTAMVLTVGEDIKKGVFEEMWEDAKGLNMDEEE